MNREHLISEAELDVVLDAASAKVGAAAAVAIDVETGLAAILSRAPADRNHGQRSSVVSAVTRSDRSGVAEQPIGEQIDKISAALDLMATPSFGRKEAALAFARAAHWLRLLSSSLEERSIGLSAAREVLVRAAASATSGRDKLRTADRRWPFSAHLFVAVVIICATFAMVADGTLHGSLLSTAGAGSVGMVVSAVAIVASGARRRRQAAHRAEVCEAVLQAIEAVSGRVERLFEDADDHAVGPATTG